MAIKILAIGKTNKGFTLDGLNEYLGRLKRYIPFQWKEVPDIKRSNKTTQQEIKQREAEIILKEVSPTTFLILLDEKGKQFTSEKFANYLEKKMVNEPDILFVIGGAYGFDQSVYDRSNEKLSLSEMTFSHQMVRMFFVEQIYRAFTIIKGEPYHHS